MIFSPPGIGPSRCGHGRAKVQGRCKDCGAVTNSHKLIEVHVVLGQTIEIPIPAMYSAYCPDCGETVHVIAPGLQCHKCWMKEQEKKKLEGGRESGDGSGAVVEKERPAGTGQFPSAAATGPAPEKQPEEL